MNADMIAALDAERLAHNLDLTVLVIDDGSPDGTGDIADALAQEHPWVQVLHRTEKVGLGKAYIAGFDVALEAGAELIMEMDCDFSHDPWALPSLLAAAVYGLPERHRAALRGARLVATPGCHVTAATLALAPLVDAGLVERTGVIVDSITGVSGAGRGLKHSSQFCTVDEDVQAYGLLDHRHTPEMEQALGGRRVTFVPHLVPLDRGLMATVHVRLTAGTAPGAVASSGRRRSSP